jgi:heme oxygenase
MVSSGTLERVLPNDKYVVRAQAMSLEILCFGEKPKHMDQSESFFGIGSLAVTDGVEFLK